MRLSDLATNVARSTQAAVRIWTEQHGRQRGLALFARRVGITERRARSLLEGTAGRIDAAEYVAALDAQAELLRHRIAAAQNELLQLERQHGVDLGARGGAAALGGAPPGGGGRVLHQEGAPLAPA